MAEAATARVRQVSVPDLEPQEWLQVKRGTPLLETMPKTTGPVVLCLNGEFLLRAHWPKKLKRNDQVEWYVDQPQDKESFRTILQVAAIVASFYSAGATAGTWGAYAGVAAAAVNVAYNLLVPPTVVQQPNDPAKSVYNASLAGNQARMDQPIWRTFGVDKVTPPFAGQPYCEFDEKGDQYYFAVFCIGYGSVDILAEFVGRTAIGSFADIVTHAYLPPGSQPSKAKANVVTSGEVTGMELETGRYVGGFIACKPGQLVESIGIDMVASQGLGKPATLDSDDTTVTVVWQFDYQQVDDSGAPIDQWRVLDYGEKTASTNTALRWSIKKELPFPMRVQVRGGRANVRNTAPNARDGIQWAGYRAYLSTPAPLNAYSSHYEVVMRASEQLSGQSQTDFNLIVQGKVRTWNPDTGWNCELFDWDNYVASRNPADAAADACSDPIYGEGLPDDRIDLATLYELKQIWAARQDRFDYTFSTTTDAWSAGQLIASAGRARMFRRYGVRTWARDELAELGASAFTPRTCIGEMSMNEVQPRSTDPDGVIIEYVSNVTWDKATVECPCPGVTEITRPIYITLDGVKGAKQAEREGLYHAADMALRTRTVSCKTEMQALVASFMLPVRWMPLIPGYGQSGDVAFWDEDTLVMGLTEQPNWNAGDLYLTLRRDDGSITTPVRVVPGPTVWDVVLPEAPDFDLVLDDGTRERPIFLLGTAGGDELVKISNRKDGGKSEKGAQLFDIEAVVDDPRVHRADNALLPGPGDEQDPIGLPGESTGGGTLIFISLTDHYITDGQEVSGGGAGAGIQFNPDGTLDLVMVANQGPNPPTRVTGEWLQQTVDPTVAALYEIYAAAPEFAFASITGSALNTWLSLGTMQSWTSTVDNFFPGVPLVLQIRKVGETIVQVNRTAHLICRTTDLH